MDPTQNNVFGNQSPMNMGGSVLPANTDGSIAPMSMGSPVASMTSGSGDVMLGGTEKKTKKWWIVGVVAAVVVVGVVAVLWFVVIEPNNRKASAEKTIIAWEDYYDYLMFGPDGEPFEDVSVENWYPEVIKTVNPGGLSYDEFNDNYYTGLRDRFDVFYDSVQEKNDSIIQYDDMLQAFVDYNMMSSWEEMIIEKFEENGLTSARNYIDSIGADLVVEDGPADSIYDYMKNYLDTFLLTVDYYDSNGCNYSEAQSLNCPLVNSSVELTTLLNDGYLQNNNMDSYYKMFFINDIFARTISVDDQIGELK